MNLKVRSEPIRAYLTNRRNRNKVLFLADAAVINAAYVLTTGVIISGYAINLGASDFIVALINNAVSYATIFSIAAYLIFERLTNRKRVLIAMALVSRTLMFLIIFLSLIRNRGLSLVLLCVLVTLAEIVWSIYRVGWLVWTMDALADDESPSRFVYQRLFLTRIATAIFSLGAGLILDAFAKGNTGFYILFIVSYLMSLLDGFILGQADSVAYQPTQSHALKRHEFLEPFRSPDYRRFLLFTVFFNLFYTLSTSFNTVYQIKHLGLNYGYVSAAGVISLSMMILSNNVWGRIEEKKGGKYVIGVSAGIVALELLALSFLNTRTTFMLLIWAVISGIGGGGFKVSIISYRYQIMPAAGKTLYEGWYYVSFGAGVLFAPFIGELLYRLIAAWGLAGWFSGYQVLYLISFLLLILLLAVQYKPASPSREKREIV